MHYNLIRECVKYFAVCVRTAIRKTSTHLGHTNRLQSSNATTLKKECGKKEVLVVFASYTQHSREHSKLQSLFRGTLSFESLLCKSHVHRVTSFNENHLLWTDSANFARTHSRFFLWKTLVVCRLCVRLRVKRERSSSWFNF